MTLNTLNCHLQDSLTSEKSNKLVRFHQIINSFPY